MITTKATLPEFVEQMIAKMNTVMEQYTPTIHAKNLTNQQVLTLASLVEKKESKKQTANKLHKYSLTAWRRYADPIRYFYFVCSRRTQRNCNVC